MIDRILDRWQPTRQRPEPDLDTTENRSVLLDRGIATVLDLLVSYLLLEIPVLYVVSELAPAAFDALGGAAVILSLVLLLPVYVTYAFAFEWRYGRTPGKVNRGLVVVMAGGEDCTARAAALRNLLRYVDLAGLPPLVVGVVVALVSDGRRVGDLVAGTVVVRSRPPDAAGHARASGSGRGQLAERDGP